MTPENPKITEPNKFGVLVGLMTSELCVDFADMLNGNKKVSSRATAIRHSCIKKKVVQISH